MFPRSISSLYPVSLSIGRAVDWGTAKAANKSVKRLGSGTTVEVAATD
jgi:hypothetical protein